MIVPDKFNMVDMEGIDLLRMQGVPVEGLYDKLVESIALCRYQCLYNWKFNDILIPPTYVEMEVGEDEEVVVNFGITVTPDDVIHLESIEPEPPEPVIIPLLAEENMVYNTPSGVDGFDPVTVDVPSYTPEIDSITITENGTYIAPTGVDGYSPIIVNVSGGSTPVPIVATASSTYASSPKQPSGIFGNIEGNFWGSSARSSWLNINFVSPLILKKILLSNYYRVSSSTYWYSSNITVRASNDGFSTYTDLYVGTGLSQSDVQFEIDLNNSLAFLEYRLIVSDTAAYGGLGRVEFIL